MQDISSPAADDSKPSSVKAQRKVQALVHEQQLLRRTALVAEMPPMGDARSAGIESREQAQARGLSQDSRESMAWLLARPSGYTEMDPLTTESALTRSLGIYEQYEGHCPKHRNNSDNTLATSHHAGLCVATGLQNLRHHTMVGTTVVVQHPCNISAASRTIENKACFHGPRAAALLQGGGAMDITNEAGALRGATDRALAAKQLCQDVTVRSVDSVSAIRTLRSHQRVGIAAATGEQDKLRHYGETLCN